MLVNPGARANNQPIVHGKNPQVLVSRVIPKGSPEGEIFVLGLPRAGSREDIQVE